MYVVPPRAWEGGIELALRRPAALVPELVERPVIASDGHSYERAAMEEWLAAHSTSPKSGEEMPSTQLIPNHALRNLIQDWMANHH